MSNDARNAALTGVAGAITAANTRNYAIRGANNTNGVAVTSCLTAIDTLEGGALPVGYDPAVLATDIIVAEDQVTCTLSTTTTPVRTATFTAYGIG